MEVNDVDEPINVVDCHEMGLRGRRLLLADLYISALSFAALLPSSNCQGAGRSMRAYQLSLAVVINGDAIRGSWLRFVFVYVRALLFGCRWP